MHALTCFTSQHRASHALQSSVKSLELGFFLQGFTFCDLIIHVVHKDNLIFQYVIRFLHGRSRLPAQRVDSLLPIPEEFSPNTGLERIWLQLRGCFGIPTPGSSGNVFKADASLGVVFLFMSYVHRIKHFLPLRPSRLFSELGARGLLEQGLPITRICLSAAQRKFCLAAVFQLRMKR